MKTNWWQRPEMILAYGIFAAIAGGAVGLHVFPSLTLLLVSLLQAEPGWHLAISGVSGAVMLLPLAANCVALGAVSGCLIVHTRGKYRDLSALGLILAGCLFSGLAAYLGLSFSGAYGRRAALAVFGTHFIWSLSLLLWGIVLTVKLHKENY